MSEEARGNGQSDMPSAVPDGQQQLIVNAQYIKDLSFENPRAPQSLIQQTAQPSVDINVDVKAQNLAPEVFEVVLTINATARIQNEPVFLVELAYGTVVTVKNAPQEMLAPLAAELATDGVDRPRRHMHPVQVTHGFGAPWFGVRGRPAANAPTRRADRVVEAPIPRSGPSLGSIGRVWSWPPAGSRFADSGNTTVMDPYESVVLLAAAQAPRP